MIEKVSEAVTVLVVLIERFWRRGDAQDKLDGANVALERKVHKRYRTTGSMNKCLHHDKGADTLKGKQFKLQYYLSVRSWSKPAACRRERSKF